MFTKPMFVWSSAEEPEAETAVPLAKAWLLVALSPRSHLNCQDLLSLSPLCDSKARLSLMQRIFYHFFHCIFALSVHVLRHRRGMSGRHTTDLALHANLFGFIWYHVSELSSVRHFRTLPSSQLAAHPSQHTSFLRT